MFEDVDNVVNASVLRLLKDVVNSDDALSDAQLGKVLRNVLQKAENERIEQNKALQEVQELFDDIRKEQLELWEELRETQERFELKKDHFSLKEYCETLNMFVYELLTRLKNKSKKYKKC